MENINQNLIEEITLLFENTAEKFFEIIHKRPSSCQNLTISQIKVLKLLNTEDSFKMKDITEHLCIASSSSTELIDKLIKEKLVERYRDIYDRRVVRVKLTKEGKDLTGDLKKIKHNIWMSIAKRLNKNEFQEVFKTSRLLYNILCEINDGEN